MKIADKIFLQHHVQLKYKQIYVDSYIISFRIGRNTKLEIELQANWMSSVAAVIVSGFDRVACFYLKKEMNSNGIESIYITNKRFKVFDSTGSKTPPDIIPIDCHIGLILIFGQYNQIALFIQCNETVGIEISHSHCQAGSLVRCIKHVMLILPQNKFKSLKLRVAVNR